MNKKHVHTVECYAMTSDGGLIYTPYRTDGLDHNLRVLKLVEFREGLGRKGLTLICKEGSGNEA